MTAGQTVWHLGLHRSPSVAPDLIAAVRGEKKIRVVRLEPAEQSLEFELTFDRFLETISAAGAYVEGDGSFVWRLGTGPAAPFFEGNAFDGRQGLRHLELKGHGTRASFEHIFRTLGWPDQPLLVQLVEEGLMVPCDEFLSWLS